MALRRKTKATFFACMFLVFAFQEMCEAAEWSASPSIMLREDYDDNIQLATQHKTSGTSTWVVPRLDFGVASNIWQVGGGAELTRRRFPGRSDLDTDAQHFSLASSYKTERSIWQLNAASSKTSYIADQKISSDIGLFTQNTNSDTKTVGPTWTWFMTELTQLQLAYSQSDVSYVNGESSGLFDYRSSSLSVKLSNQFDIYTQIFLSPVYSVFRVPATTFESKSTSFQAGITRKFSETLNGTLSVGGRNTSSEHEVLVCKLFLGPFCLQTAQEMTSSRDSSSIFSANLEKQFETLHLTAIVSRSFDPSATGQQVQTDFASFSLSKPFTATLTGNLATYSYRISSETGGVAGADDRRLYQIAPSLRWQWAPEWNLDTGYRYTHLQRVSETTAATSNAAYLTLTYQWPKISISR